MAVPFTHFLLRNMEPDLRMTLEAEAEQAGEPLIEVIRRILCDHYELDCSPVKDHRANWKRKWEGSPTVLLKLQPELFDAVKRDSDETGETMRDLILNALEAHYASVT